jgi:hypothetical protein
MFTAPTLLAFFLSFFLSEVTFTKVGVTIEPTLYSASLVNCNVLVCIQAVPSVKDTDYPN